MDPPTNFKLDDHSDDNSEIALRTNAPADDDFEDKMQMPKDVFNANELEGIAESIALCKKPLCDDADMQCIIDMVDATLCEAVIIIESDPRGLFCYKYPEILKPPAAAGASSAAVDVIVTASEVDGAQTTITTAAFQFYSESHSTTSGYMRHWMTIEQFEYNNIIGEIRDLVGMWQLSPETKCVVLSNPRTQEVPPKGTIYFVDAHFSRPTPRCPNPLAVAKVRFIITVSSVLLSNYPVMITYRFEGYNTLYYAVGHRAINSFTFQRFYIDTILHTKLSFYAEICKCRHGTVDKPKQNVRPKKAAKRPNFEFDLK